MQALENQRSFFFGDMEMLHWVHMGLELDRARVTKGHFRFWEAIQEWKAVCLVDAMARSMANDRQATRIVESLAAESKEQGVLPIQEAPPEQEDVPPAPVNDVGETNVHNAFLAHSQLSQTTKGEELEKELWSMAEVAEQHLGPGKSVIFIDWARYEDTFFLAAYNATSGELINRVAECDYSAVEHWVATNIGSSEDEQGKKNRKRLRQTDKLKALHPLFEKLNTFIEKDDLLVLCAAGILRSVPLHAIPFPNIEDLPLIAHNPVVYCASNALMARCVSRANGDVPDSCHAIAFARLGPEDPIEEARMHETAKLAMQYFSKPIIVSGREATRRAFIDTSKNADFLHYHGHASLESSTCKDRALILEPIDSDLGLLDVMDIFGLQIRAATVVLLACASGEEELAPNDDPLGIISAFMYAGASSIVGTLWPTQTEDARQFSQDFYRYAFGGDKSQGGIRHVYLAKAFQQAVLGLYELWDGDEPYHWAHFQLRKTLLFFEKTFGLLLACAHR
jgi:CHAT domain-containing protein